MKITLQGIQTVAAAYNYQVLSEEYSHSKDNLQWKCDKGHVYEASWNNFKKGRRCPVCYGNAKYSLEEVRSIAAISGYFFLSDKYMTNKTKYLFRCPNGHEFPMAWSNFIRGHRCPACAGNKKKDAEEIVALLDGMGYRLLEGEYQNNRSELIVQCNRGHVYPTSWHNLVRGHKCPECRYD